MPLVETAPHWECELCGLAVGWVVNDLPAGEEEVGVPPGWVRLDARMVSPNPELAAYRAALETTVTSLAASFAGDGEVTSEHVTTARELVEAQAAEGEPPKHYVEIDASFCLCHECKPYLSRLEIKDFGEAAEEAAETGTDG